MRLNLPQENLVYLQTNRSTVEGNLWSTMGIDFQSNLGVVRVDPRLQVLTATGDTNATTFGRPVAYASWNGVYWTLAGSKIYMGGFIATTAFVEDTNTGAASDYTSNTGDLTTFNSRLWATAPTKLRSLSGGAWTDRATFTDTSQPHMMSRFDKLGRLYVIHATNIIASINSSDVYSSTGDYSLTIGTDYQFTCIRQTANYLYIGVTNSGDETGQGAVIQWDGISAQPTAIYYLPARGCLSMVVNSDIPYIMDNRAALRKYTGTGFDEIGRLPVPFRLFGSMNTGNNRFIHPNGLLVTKNDTILALVNNLNGDTAGTINQNLPSGVWEWAQDFGFTHKEAVSYNRYDTPATITDWGQNRISVVGALGQAFDNIISGTVTLFVGATYFTDATTTTNAIFIQNTNDTVQKKGYFVTVFNFSDQIEEKWSRFWTKYRKFLDANDKMVFKYRTTEVAPLEATITWVDTTHFTTPTDVTAYAPTASGFDGTTGGEVEVVQGAGSGGCSHITSITGPSAGLYTVTVDETYTGVTTGTAKARFQKWIKAGSVSADVGAVKQWEQLAINEADDTRIEVKCCMTWTGQGEFYKLIVESSLNIKITQ